MSLLSGLWDKLRAATKLAPVTEPKVKVKQQTLPSYLKTATPNDNVLLRSDSGIINKDLTTLRLGGDSRKVVHDYAKASPDLSAAANAYLRTAITSRYTAVSKNMDGTFNREATALLQQLLTRFNVVPNYDDGFAGTDSLRSLSESLGVEILFYGACALELVLDKSRLPSKLAPVSVTKIEFKPDNKVRGLKPIQKLSGTEIDLDIPTFFYVSLDQDLLEPYATSPFEPAMQPALAMQEFMDDLRRIVKRVVHPRLLVSIDEEKFRKNLPPDVVHDSEKLVDYMKEVITDIESRINGLNPEDALVLFDSLGVDLLNNGNISLDAEYRTLQDIYDAKMTTGAKALPSILGHGSGSQNIASSETLLFMKNAAGSVQEKLNEIFSRALTLAIRLFGFDCYAEFRYADIDLRPESELEAFRAMRQSRVLELLSLGFLTDDEASIALTGQLTPAGFTTLSGTGFFKGAQVDPNATNGYTNQSSGGGAGGAGRQKNNDAPSQPKGPVKRVK